MTTPSQKKGLTQEAIDEGTPRFPVETKREFQEYCATLLISGVHIVAVIFLAVSSFMILWLYPMVILTGTLSAAQQLTLNYSITIFAGAGIYLLVYLEKVDGLVKKMLKVKDVPKIPAPAQE